MYGLFLIYRQIFPPFFCWYILINLDTFTFLWVFMFETSLKESVCHIQKNICIWGKFTRHTKEANLESSKNLNFWRTGNQYKFYNSKCTFSGGATLRIMTLCIMDLIMTLSIINDTIWAFSVGYFILKLLCIMPSVVAPNFILSH
jgi:hypothetical protein